MNFVQNNVTKCGANFLESEQTSSNNNQISQKTVKNKYDQ